jgi:hypothetical protein
MKAALRKEMKHDPITTSFSSVNRISAAPEISKEDSSREEEDLNRFHAQLIIEALTPFLGVLVDRRPDSTPRK